MSPATALDSRPGTEGLTRPQGRVVELEIGDELRPPWLAADSRLPIWLEADLAPLPSGARALAHIVEHGERSPSIVASHEGILFGFDAAATADAIQCERYLTPRRPFHTLLPLPYQLVPGSIRLAVFAWLTRNRVPTAGLAFPDWPVDRSVETLRWISDRARGHTGHAPDAVWPLGKKWAFCISHDVDTRKGIGAIPDIARFEESLGLRSCWFIVGNLFSVDPVLIDGLRARGHEIGLHGDVHDNRIAYVSREQIARRLEGCRDSLDRHSIRGFRSPSLLETPALRAELTTRFDYASQIPDTEIDSLIAARRGCGTCFPFWKQGLLELPLTLPLEDKLVMAGLDTAGIARFWRQKIAWAREVGGVAQLSVHNEPHLLQHSRAAIEEVLRDVVGDDSAWCATPGEVTDRWKESIR